MWVSYIADIKILIYYLFEDMLLIRVGKASMEKQPWVASRRTKNFKEINRIEKFKKNK